MTTKNQEKKNTQRVDRIGTHRGKRNRIDSGIFSHRGGGGDDDGGSDLDDMPPHTTRYRPRPPAIDRCSCIHTPCRRCFSLNEPLPRLHTLHTHTHTHTSARARITLS